MQCGVFIPPREGRVASSASAEIAGWGEAQGKWPPPRRRLRRRTSPQGGGTTKEMRTRSVLSPLLPCGRGKSTVLKALRRLIGGASGD